ncbi:spore germination protein [Cohnella sp. OV330]|uniref:GerAB/ArcD/ProY family transporter n=1 Tax=Cohnella sp. OV330 TaxID=1855288 RepID=UPI0008E1F9A2|nr:endospore germination permease [Cohnella sp. OV330]SFB09204.1 spore germination protein [Cohnella sp. OV330]
MTKATRDVTATQASAVLVSTIIGVGVLPLPLFAVRAADTGGPLVTLLGSVCALIGLLFVAALGMRFPDQSIIQYSERLIGKWPARAIGACLIVFFALLTSLTAREFGEVVVTSVLKQTPVEVTVIVMLMLAAISARNTMSTFAYIHFFYVPLLLVPVLLIVALSLKNAELLNLQPFWGNKPEGMLQGILTIAALFQGSFVMTIVIPAMRRPAKALSVSLYSILIAGGLYVVIVIAVVGVFGAQETRKLLWPTLELAKATSLPANVLERLDGAFLAVWVTAVFTTLLSSYYLTSQSLKQLLRLEEPRIFTFFLLPFVFVLAMVPANIVKMYEAVLNVGKVGLALTTVYPGLLLVIAWVRKKRGSAHER